MGGIWKGEGWYRMGWSDGGMDWTSDGPEWFESEAGLGESYDSGRRHETEAHLLWCEYLGSGDEPLDS